MWPLILQQIKAIIESNKDNNIIIVEAAVLLRANWQIHCHEVWATIIPPDEVKLNFLNNKYTAIIKFIIKLIVPNFCFLLTVNEGKLYGAI